MYVFEKVHTVRVAVVAVFVVVVAVAVVVVVVENLLVRKIKML